MAMGDSIVNLFLRGGSVADAGPNSIVATSPETPVVVTGSPISASPTAPIPEPAATSVPVTGNAEADALRAELERERAERIRERAQFVEQAAGAFYTSLLQANRVLPAEQAGLIALYRILAEDDMARPVGVALADGTLGNRLDALRGAYQARPAHTLRQEQLPAGANVLTNRQHTDPSAEPTSAERVEELLKHTSEGQRALAQAAVAANGHKN